MLLLPSANVQQYESTVVPPNFWDWQKNQQYSETAVLGGPEYNLKIPYLGLEMGGGIGWDYNPSRLGIKELIYGTTMESRAQFLIV